MPARADEAQRSCDDTVPPGSPNVDLFEKIAAVPGFVFPRLGLSGRYIGCLS